MGKSIIYRICVILATISLLSAAFYPVSTAEDDECLEDTAKVLFSSLREIDDKELVRIECDESSIERDSLRVAEVDVDGFRQILSDPFREYEIVVFDISFVVEITSLDEERGGVSGRGDIVGTEFGFMTFSMTEGRVSATVEIPGTGSQYLVRYNTEADDHYLYERPTGVEGVEGVDGSYSPSTFDYEVEEHDTGAQHDIYDTDQHAQVDVMVVYTSDAASWASSNDGSIYNSINEANQRANLVMDNSEVGVTLNIVHTHQVDYQETGDDLSTDISRLGNENDGYMEEIHDLRDYHGADLVSMFVRTTGNTIGVAYAPREEYHLRPSWGFSVVSVQHASSNDVYIHELGHNFGAGHAEEQEHQPGPQLYDYSAGWRWITGTWPGRRRYRTVMAYNTYDYVFFDYEPVPYFSNPDIEHWDNDEPLGCYVNADNARTIRETKHVIASYQQPTPQVEMLSDLDGVQWYEGSEQEIRWDTVSGDNGISGIDIHLLQTHEGGSLEMVLAEDIQDTGSHSFRLPNEPGEDYRISIRATDGAGYSRDSVSETTFDILEDNFPPEIDILGPEHGGIFNDDEITVSWSGNDDYSGIDYYEVRAGFGSWTRVEDAEHHTFDELIDGNQSISVRAWDRAGNMNTDSIEFLLDTDPPYIDIYGPVQGAVLHSSDVKVSWVGTDFRSGISHFEIRLNNGTWENIGDQRNYTFEDLEEGTYTVSVRAVDNAGNTATMSTDFEVEDRTIFTIFIDIISTYRWIFLALIFAIAIVLLAVLVDKRKEKYRYPHNQWSHRNVVECGNCGTTIPGTATSCLRCGVEFRQDTVKCNNCGSLVNSDASRCPDCGLFFYRERNGQGPTVDKNG